jgi:transcriptional antiterminator NusG
MPIGKRETMGTQPLEHWWQEQKHQQEEDESWAFHIPEGHDERALDWFVLRTNIKCERRAAKGLKAKGFGVYVPRTRRVIRVRRSKLRREVRGPLFVRYMFVGLDHRRPDWFGVRSTDGVQEVLCFNMVPVRVPYETVEGFRVAEDMGLFDQSEQQLKLKPGEIVRLIEGPLEGLSATVAKSPHHGELVSIELHLFGRSAPALVPLDKIRRVA